MENKNDLKTINKDISRNTKIYVLLAFLMIVLNQVFKPDDLGFTFIALFSLFAVVLVDYYQIISHKYPKLWNIIKWIIMMIIVMFVLIGFINK